MTDDSHGFWRRIKVIPFHQQFDGARADDQLIGKLKAEAQGILNWAIQGCIEWQRGGLGMPPVVAQAIEEYRDENDPLSDFIEEQCVVSPEAQVEVVLSGMRISDGPAITWSVLPSTERRLRVGYR